MTENRNVKRNVKSNPADENCKFTITYSQIQVNKEKTEMKAYAVERDSELLLKSFGFGLNDAGEMSLKAPDNDYIRVDENVTRNNKNKIERIVDGKVLSKSEVDNATAERWMENEKARRSENDKKDESVR